MTPARSTSPPEATPVETPSASAPSASIADFLTDGSLAALCEQVSRLTSLHVELRDPENRVIETRGPGDWGFRAPRAEPVVSVPLMLGTERIGAITIGPGEVVLGADARDSLVSAIALLARTASEIVQHEVHLKHRIKEVTALGRLSTMLVRSAGPERVLDVALDLALDTLELDAGSIVLFREDPGGGILELEEDMVLKAHRGLSREWLDNPNPLSKDRVFDKMAMMGKMAVSEDLATDERILLREEAAREGLRAALHAGLTFNDRTLGVIRLYSHQPRVFTDQDKRLLSSLAQQAAVALEQARLQTIEKEEQRVQRQLQLAVDVQRRMLPRSVPTIPGLDVAGRYVPSFELGGDFYDFIDLAGHLGIAIGDAVGKGIAAALLMASVRSSLRAHAEEVYDLDEVITRVNRALCRDTRDSEFASLWYGVIDPRKLRLTYCSAGHEPPLVVRVPKHRAPTDADADELSVGGMIVGIDPSQRYQRAVFDLHPRDVLLAYTDGLTDVANFQGERFGKKRVRAALLAGLGEDPEAPAQALIERVLWEVRQFVGLSTARPDDQTLVVLRVREP